MTARLSAAHEAARSSAAASASLATLAAGPGVPELRIYTAPRPASIGHGSATLLVAVELADPPGTVSGADLTLVQAADALITATGAPAWALLVDGHGDPFADFSAGPPPAEPGDPTPDVVINAPTLYAGGYLRLSPLVLAG